MTITGDVIQDGSHVCTFSSLLPKKKNISTRKMVKFHVLNARSSILP